MVKSLVWQDLNRNQISEINALGSSDECFEYMRKIFGLVPDAKNDIVLDLYLHTLKYYNLT